METTGKYFCKVTSCLLNISLRFRNSGALLQFRRFRTDSVLMVGRRERISELSVTKMTQEGREDNKVSICNTCERSTITPRQRLVEVVSNIQCKQRNGILLLQSRPLVFKHEKIFFALLWPRYYKKAFLQWKAIFSVLYSMSIVDLK